MEKDIKTDGGSCLKVYTDITPDLGITITLKTKIKDGRELKLFNINGDLFSQGEPKHSESFKRFPTVSRARTWVGLVLNEIDRYENSYSVLEKEIQDMMEDI